MSSSFTYDDKRSDPSVCRIESVHKAVVGPSFRICHVDYLQIPLLGHIYINVVTRKVGAIDRVYPSVYVCQIRRIKYLSDFPEVPSYGVVLKMASGAVELGAVSQHNDRVVWFRF